MAVNIKTYKWQAIKENHPEKAEMVNELKIRLRSRRCKDHASIKTHLHIRFIEENENTDVVIRACCSKFSDEIKEIVDDVLQPQELYRLY